MTVTLQQELLGCPAGPHGVSYLPPAFQVTFDPEPAAALAHPSGQAAAQTAAAGKGKLAGAGSKRRAQQHRTTAVQLDANVAAAGGHSKAGRRAATKRAYVESDDGWESDEGELAHQTSLQGETAAISLLQQCAGVCCFEDIVGMNIVLMRNDSYMMLQLA